MNLKTNKNSYYTLIKVKTLTCFTENKVMTIDSTLEATYIHCFLSWNYQISSGLKFSLKSVGVLMKKVINDFLRKMNILKRILSNIKILKI